jgi:hypothetical protein
MHFYMHSYLHKNFILAKSGCYRRGNHALAQCGGAAAGGASSTGPLLGLLGGYHYGKEMAPSKVEEKIAHPGGG